MSIEQLLQRLDRLIGAMEAHTAVAAGLTSIIAQHTGAMNAVAGSHAQLLAALLAQEEEPAASGLDDEMRRTIEESGVIG